MLRPIVALVLVTALCAGCTPRALHDSSPPAAPSQPVVAKSQFEVIAQYKLTVVGGAETTTVVLPANLSEGPEWGTVQAACLASGYDLRPYAGRRVQVTQQPLSDRYQGQRSRLLVITYDGRLVGACALVDGYHPPTLALEDFVRGK